MSCVSTIEIDQIPSETDPQLTPAQNIPRVPAANLSFQQFFTEFMVPNLPVIITNVSTNWDCQRSWISDGQLDTTHLKMRLTDRQVPVANCSKQFFNSHEKSDMKLHEFLEYWDQPCAPDALIYLKDWHLRKEEPDYEFYQVPEYFASDWLNEFLIDTGSDDYRFCYFGREGTWTSFHADVFASYSWSTNILGQKRWLLLPPNEELKLRDGLNNLPFSITPEILQQKSVQYFEIFQNAGEAIFVPSQWYHQVTNEQNTVSVNHNWFNGCNVEVIYQALVNSYESVMKEIDDCRDMEGFFEHCQVMLKSLHGMNFEGFVQILQHIAEKRIGQLGGGEEICVFDHYKIGRRLAKFDLLKIEQILQRLVSANDGLADKLGLNVAIEQLMDKINKASINS
jgi:JmjC domain, hydroxylase